MPRPNRGGEKPRNFKTAIIRLFTELKSFHVAIITAIILTTISSILSIFTPNILKDLTNKISEGLVVNKDNLEKIYFELNKNLSEEKIENLTKNTKIYIENCYKIYEIRFC